jgi:hypothetical protein
LTGELGPSCVTDGAGQLSVGDEVSDGEVFQAEPVVGLDELAGDVMKEASAGIGDPGVLPGQPPDRLGSIS